MDTRDSCSRAGVEGRMSYTAFEQLSAYWKLIRTTNNYVFYRLLWAKAPGLPFLVPHTCRTNIVKKARDFFEFISYYEWRESMKKTTSPAINERQT
jgi:hypothetical protein